MKALFNIIKSNVEIVRDMKCGYIDCDKCAFNPGKGKICGVTELEIVISKCGKDICSHCGRVKE